VILEVGDGEGGLWDAGDAGGCWSREWQILKVIVLHSAHCALFCPFGRVG
jgi:hypothetical protein